MRYRLDDLNAWWSREYNTLPEVKEAASKRIEQTDGDCTIQLFERIDGRRYRPFGGKVTVR